MTTVPPTGPVSVGNVTTIWSLPAVNCPIGANLRLAAGTYSPASQTFPVSTTSTFPLSKFLGLSFYTTVALTTGTSWTSTFTGTGTVLLVGGGAGGGPSSPRYRSPPSGVTILPGWEGGGGGAGQAFTLPYPFTKGAAYSYTIGLGGSSGASGTSTTWQGTSTALRGGSVPAGGPGVGQPGGSGGGGSVAIAPPGAFGPSFGGGTGTAPGGNPGSPGAAAGAGGGGGAGGAGGTPSSCNGGAGINFPYSGGTQFAGGGCGVALNLSPVVNPWGGGSSLGNSNGGNATTYGSGGGGGGCPTALAPRVIRTGGLGYQGIIYIGFG